MPHPHPDRLTQKLYQLQREWRRRPGVQHKLLLIEADCRASVRARHQQRKEAPVPHLLSQRQPIVLELVDNLLEDGAVGASIVVDTLSQELDLEGAPLASVAFAQATRASPYAAVRTQTASVARIHSAPKLDAMPTHGPC